MAEEQIKETEELEEVSEETEAVSEETPEGETITFKTKAELETHIGERVKSESNRIANLSTAPIQSERDKLKEENTRLIREAEYRVEDTKLGRLTKAQSQEWKEAENTEHVGLFQDAVRDLTDRNRESLVKEQGLSDKEENLRKTGLRQNAFEKALRLFLPEDNEFISDIDALVKKLEEATTEREMDLIYSMEESRIKAKAEAPPRKRPKPDPIINSAPGGTDFSKLSPRDKISAGLKEMNKKK